MLTDVSAVSLDMGLVDDIRELCRSILESSFPAHIFGLLLFFVGSLLIYSLSLLLPFRIEIVIGLLCLYYAPGLLIYAGWNHAMHGTVYSAEQHTSIPPHVVIIVVSYAVWITIGRLLSRFLTKDNRDPL